MQLCKHQEGRKHIRRNIPLVDASYLTSNTLSFNKMPAAAFGIQMRQAGIFGPINIP